MNDVLAALLEMEGPDSPLKDSTVSVDLGLGHVEIEVAVVADSLDEGASLGDSFVRAAIHKAGGHTPDWSSARNDADWVQTEKNAALTCA